MRCGNHMFHQADLVRLGRVDLLAGDRANASALLPMDKHLFVLYALNDC
jgi:hypothetical protein